MANAAESPPLRWRYKHLSGSNSSVPTSPGVYAIGHCDSLHGLELNRVYVDVGGTTNLQRRLNEHLPENEENPNLRAYLRRNYATAVCWYAPTEASRWRAILDDLVRHVPASHAPQDYVVNPDRPSSLRWRYKPLSGSNSSVPTSPGVYAIGHCDSVHGLELNRVYVYVGESMNLQRRFGEHLPDTEDNPDLRDHLRRNYTTAVCWCTPTQASRRKAVQDDLIRELQPEFNTLGL